MCAFVEPYGRCDQSRELRNFCTPCYAAAEIERLQARIEVLEGSIDYLRHVIDHPVTQVQAAIDGLRQPDKLWRALKYWEAKKLALDAVRPDFTPDQLREL